MSYQDFTSPQLPASVASIQRQVQMESEIDTLEAVTRLAATVEAMNAASQAESQKRDKEAKRMQISTWLVIAVATFTLVATVVGIFVK